MDRQREVVEAMNPILHWVEVLGLFALIIIMCYILFYVYTNASIKSVVKNRVLFGMLVFGVLVFLVHEFGDSLSNDTKALLIGNISGSIVTIILFLFDKDKETKDNDDEDL